MHEEYTSGKQGAHGAHKKLFFFCVLGVCMC